MGTIISSRVKDDGKLVFETVVDYDEALQLKGHLSNVHLFSENSAETKANISLRGKNDATTYFLIPKDLRKGLRSNAKTNCQRIDSKGKIIFVYVVDKTG